MESTKKPVMYQKRIEKSEAHRILIGEDFKHKAQIQRVARQLLAIDFEKSDRPFGDKSWTVTHPDSNLLRRRFVVIAIDWENRLVLCHWDYNVCRALTWQPWNISKQLAKLFTEMEIFKASKPAAVTVQGCPTVSVMTAAGL